MSKWILPSVAMLLICARSLGLAGTILFSGTITQSTADGTGPAVNNLSLNNIVDGQAFSGTLAFAGSITSPGTYTPTSLTFDVASAPSTEAGFSSISLVIANVAGVDQLSVFGCLVSGTGCFVGNQLDANFSIPAAMLNSPTAAATGLDQPHPLDLLEDDGITEIQGSITQYSYTETAPVPEPSEAVPLACIAVALLIVKTKSLNSRTHRRTP